MIIRFSILLVIDFGKCIIIYIQIHIDTWRLQAPLTNVFVLLFISQDCTQPTKYIHVRLILIMGMKLCVTINQLVNSSYLTPSNLASPIFSGWLSFHKVWNTVNHSVFYMLKVLFCVLPFASSMPPFKQSDVTTDIFNSRDDI